MTLAVADKEEILELIERVISTQPEATNSTLRYELDLNERIVRVEEELKHQREMMIEGFKRMDERFEQVDKRFEQVDKRFEQMGKRMDRFMFWSLGLTISATIFVVNFLK